MAKDWIRDKRRQNETRRKNEFSQDEQFDVVFQ